MAAFTYNLPIIDAPGINEAELHGVYYDANLAFIVGSLTGLATFLFLIYMARKKWGDPLNQGPIMATFASILVGICAFAFVQGQTDAKTDNRRAALAGTISAVDPEPLEHHFAAHVKTHSGEIDEDFSAMTVTDPTGRTCTYDLEVGRIADSGLADVTFTPDAKACDEDFNADRLTEVPTVRVDGTADTTTDTTETDP